MNKKLVVYFSASGTTKKIAEEFAKITGADIHEIKASISYTDEDLDWNDSNSRSSREMRDLKSRPEIAEKLSNMNEYDVIYLGFPIWWETAPKIISTFLESYDFSGKKIITFATSGGSGMGNITSELKISAPNAEFISGKVLRTNDIEDFFKSLNIE